MAKNSTSQRTSKRGLTAAQRLFAHELAVPGTSQTVAYLSAFPRSNPRSAATEAGRLLKNPDVAALVEQLRQRALEKVDAKAEAVLEELRHVGFARLSRCLEVLPEGDLKIRPVETWGEDELAAVSKVKVQAIFEGAGEDRTHVGNLVSLEAGGKLGALETLAKHHKLLTEKVEHEHRGTVLLVDPYAKPPAAGASVARTAAPPAGAPGDVRGAAAGRAPATGGA